MCCNWKKKKLLYDSCYPSLFLKWRHKLFWNLVLKQHLRLWEVRDIKWRVDPCVKVSKSPVQITPTFAKSTQFEWLIKSDFDPSLERLLLCGRFEFRLCSGPTLKVTIACLTDCCTLAYSQSSVHILRGKLYLVIQRRWRRTHCKCTCVEYSSVL